jgi:tetratricopeptide (TPR) repeat protein
LDKKKLVTSNIFVNDNLWIDNNERGARKFDPEKYIKDALRLKDQFFETLLDDPYGLNYRSVFYTAQSYFDSKHYKEAIQWYRLFTKLKETWNEELFESHLRIARCMINLKYPTEKIEVEIDKAIKIFSDRAEPYFTFGKYLNDISQTEKAYSFLKNAKTKNYDVIKEKYVLFVNKYNPCSFIVKPFANASWRITVLNILLPVKYKSANAYSSGGV